MPDVDPVVEALLERQLDAEPDREPAGLGRALVGRLHHARAAAGDHRVAGPGQRARRAARPARTRGCRGLVRAEPNTLTAGGSSASSAEALDELGLDPQHPPRVGVHPVGRAAVSQQPLVGGAGGICVAGAAPPGRGGCSRRCRRRRRSCRCAYRLVVGRSRRSRTRDQPRSGQPAGSAHARSAASHSAISSGTCSSRVCARFGSPGPKFTRRDAERREPGHVGPAELGHRRRPPTAARNSCGRRGGQPGQRARRASRRTSTS